MKLNNEITNNKSVIQFTNQEKVIKESEIFSLTKYMNVMKNVLSNFDSFEKLTRLKIFYEMYIKMFIEQKT